MRRIVLALFFMFDSCGLPILYAGEKDAVAPVNLEKINTEADEDNPCILSDGTTLLFDSNKSGRYEIMVSKRAGAGAWGAAKVHLASKEADYRSPFYRQGILYFAHNKVPDEKLKDLKNFDLVQKQLDRAPLPLLGVSEPEDELHPWITTAGKEFYFSRKTKEGWMLFVALGPVPGPIGKAKEVGLPVGFHHASLSSNGLVMYLQGPVENDRQGLFRAKRAKVGGAWADPEPLKSLNHADAKRGDISPCLSSDGTRLYFASDRPGGKGGLDLWSVATKDLK